MEHEYEDQQSKSLAYYLSVLRRRRKYSLIVALLVVITAISSAFLIPPKYRSSAIILIEEQDIPSDLVRSTITSYAVQRIEEIRQRIMTVNNILDIADQFELYTSTELKKMTRSEIAIDFKKNVSLSPISADVVDPRSGKPTQAVIAFSISFSGKNRSKVQRVTNELVTLFLNENLKERAKQSASTFEFLEAEAKALNQRLKDYENQISSFKEKHKGSLPELNGYNMSAIDRAQGELLETQTRIHDLEIRKLGIESRLITLSPTAPSTLATGETVLGPNDRLKALVSELAQKSAIYKSGHPDLARLQREINTLETKVGNQQNKQDTASLLHDINLKLQHAKDKFKPGHPTIHSLKRRKEFLEKDLITEKEIKAHLVPDNPTYVLLKTQTKSADAEIEALKGKMSVLKNKIKTHEDHLLRAPTVEKDYYAILRDYDNSRLKYQEIKAKQMTAELAQNLEQERKGERFTMIQPPELPQKPYSPKKLSIIFAGIFIAIALAIGSAFLIEALDPKIYGQTEITKISGIEPLVVISALSTPSQKKRSTYKIVFTLLILLLLGITLLVLFHFFIKPLDVTWYILMRRYNLM